jgi:hypothetical protein
MNINPVVLQWVQLIIYVGLFIFAGNQILGTFARALKSPLEVFNALWHWSRRRRGRKMIERAREVGIQVVTNVEARITAACAYSQFKDELLIQHHRRSSDLATVKVGSSEWKKLITEKLIVAPPKIYTFSDSWAAGITAFSGDREMLEGMGANLVYHHTGIRKRDVSRKDFETTLDLLITRDPRLYVPFADGGKNLTEEQWLLYAGRDTASEMMSHLLK